MSKQNKQDFERRYKGARIEKSEAQADDLEAINLHTIDTLTADDVFTFKVVMCDNRIDRTFEAFNEESLNELAGLFVGRTFIKDHDWGADNQVARIYATELVEAGGISDTGEKYLQLQAKCYMLVNDATASLIAEIKGGIKKEVSVGFRLASAVCSICGVDNMKAYCEHWNGKEYDGELCYFTLAEVTDAYELSFVAVPAQPAAGATKNYAGEPMEEDAKEVPEVTTEEGEEPPPDIPEEQEKELNTRMRLMGAFLFSQGGING